MPFNPDPYNTPDVSVSPLSIKSLLNWSPRICAHIMLWFGNPGHLNPGYRSDDPVAVAQQVSLLKQRGVDFAMLDWYGTLASPQAAAALLWKAECERQNLKFAICMDRGIFQSWNMPKGVGVTTWATQMMQYAYTTFLSSPMYERTEDGRHLMINFDWTGVTGLDSAKVLAPYTDVAMLYEHSGGVSKPHSSGAFAWVGVSTDTQSALENYASNFLSATAKSFAANGDLIVMGSLVKGFDDHGRRPGLDPTKSCWDQTQPARFADEKNGQTFLNIIATYNASKFKPKYMQIVTWSDYEEDTEMERGADSQLTAAVAASNGILTATLVGNLDTVDHVDVYVNGQIVWTEAAAASLTFDLSTLKPTNNQQFACYVVAVGKPFFQNKFSSTITTTAALVAAQTVQVAVSTSVQVPVPPSATVALDTTVALPISTTVQGLSVSGTLILPVKQTVQVPLNQTPITLPVNQMATAQVTSQIVWS